MFRDKIVAKIDHQIIMEKEVLKYDRMLKLPERHVFQLNET